MTDFRTASPPIPTVAKKRNAQGEKLEGTRRGRDPEENLTRSHGPLLPP